MRPKDGTLWGKEYHEQNADLAMEESRTSRRREREAEVESLSGSGVSDGGEPDSEDDADMRSIASSSTASDDSILTDCSANMPPRTPPSAFQPIELDVSIDQCPDGLRFSVHQVHGNQIRCTVNGSPTPEGPGGFCVVMRTEAPGNTVEREEREGSSEMRA